MKQTLWIYTIVLDGMPWLPLHLPEFQKIKGDWKWIIVEGRASKSHCTNWIAGGNPGVSTDGSHEYLQSISTHPRVTVISRPLWDGKISMIKEAIRHMDRPGYLHECDVDELWTAEHLEKVANIYDTNQRVGRMMFNCDYRVGPNLRLVGDGMFGNKDFEWSRSWRYRPGDRAVRHEPPEMRQMNPGRLMTKEETKQHGLTFLHQSYVDDKSVHEKCRYYGYGEGGYQSWKALQTHKEFPCRLNQFFPWCQDNAEVHLVT